jgi:hypothetical protein
MRTLRLSVVAAGLLAAAAVSAGCLGTGEDRVLSIEATGVVRGLVYFDANGSREPESSDPPVERVGVRLVVAGTQDTLARAVTGADGLFQMPAVPVGTYTVAVDAATVPDSLEVVGIDPETVIAGREDTATTVIALSFPKVTVEEARDLPVGERVFVDGVALNARTAFGDQTIHLAGAARAIRVTRVRQATIFTGDSVRFLATTSTLDGQPTLDDAEPFLLAIAEKRKPERVETATAATADGGRLDAALVEIAGATIADTATVADGLALTVDDGSGPVEVLLDSDVRFEDLTIFVPGAVLDATGVLVPVPGVPGTWQIKPRSNADVTVP